ncbi:glycosyltransferase family 2 protein [Polaribacter tangerinus]|uniref:glycosyltransferase family 2 protein n=1 Tax=Polaribacter tangerinus TaxID=1920034 RepID=UPI000B4B3D63|nr:glycosyltransferase family 2 protein [Polaribacter tangerinus]
MQKKVTLSATIVLYKEPYSILKETITSFLNLPFSKQLYLVDNSPTDQLKECFKQPDIRYFHMNKNVGFGKGHNFMIDKLDANYHLILNPDISFSTDIISPLINALEEDVDLAFITPKVLYPNKSEQTVCRNHPSFWKLILRKFSKTKSSNQYISVNNKLYPEFVHGCFMLFRTEHFIRLNGFDERYFLYMEDADICRKIDRVGLKKMYYPEVEIIHHHKKSSSKNVKLFFIHTSSAIKYFLKWGF